MKHMKTVVVPKQTRECVDFVTCDLCLAKIENKDYHLDEVEIWHKEGDNYPECGSGTEIIVDMCGKCFDEKLVPWLRTQGAVPLTKDWDR